MGKSTGEIREEIERTRDRMGETVDAIAYKADVPNRMREAVGARVASMKQSIRTTTGTVRARVREIVPDPSTLRQQTMDRVAGVRENPLGLLVGAAAVGLLVGFVLPRTTIENDRLGGVAQDLARRAGAQAMARGKAAILEDIEVSRQIPLE